MKSQKIYSGYRSLLLAARNTVAPEDKIKIRKALDLAITACGGDITLTGELKIHHALSVARIIAGEVGLGLTSIITALLHDSYNNLDISQQDLEKELQEKGRIFISKDSGLFEAIK